MPNDDQFYRNEHDDLVCSNCDWWVPEGMEYLAEDHDCDEWEAPESQYDIKIPGSRASVIQIYDMRENTQFTVEEIQEELSFSDEEMEYALEYIKQNEEEVKEAVEERNEFFENEGKASLYDIVSKMISPHVCR